MTRGRLVAPRPRGRCRSNARRADRRKLGPASRALGKGGYSDSENERDPDNREPNEQEVGSSGGRWQGAHYPDATQFYPGKNRQTSWAVTALSCRPCSRPCLFLRRASLGRPPAPPLGAIGRPPRSILPFPARENLAPRAGHAPDDNATRSGSSSHPRHRSARA